MQYVCSTVAGIALALKERYRKILSTAPGYGSDTTLTRDIDSLGLLIKELEDAIVILQIKGTEQHERAPDERVLRGAGANEKLYNELALP